MEMDSIYEEIFDSYIDDYTIFENTLQRDYFEVTGIITEEANNRNFLQKIWDFILKIFKTIKEKIDGIIEKFIVAWDNKRKQSDDQLLARYITDLGEGIQEYYERKNAKGFRINIGTRDITKFEMSKFHDFKAIKNDGFIDKIVNMVDDLDFNNLDKKRMENMIEEIKTPEEIKKDTHYGFFEEEETQYPFKKDPEKMVEKISHVITNYVSNERSIKNGKKKILNALTKKENEAKKILKDLERKSKKQDGFKDLGSSDKSEKESNKTTTEPTKSNNNTNSNNNIKRIEMRKEATVLLSEEVVKDVNVSSDTVEKARMYIKLLTKTKPSIVASVKCLLNENMRMYTEAKRCLIKAAHYCKFELNISFGTKTQRDVDAEKANKYEKQEEKRQEKDKKKYS